MHYEASPMLKLWWPWLSEMVDGSKCPPAVRDQRSWINWSRLRIPGWIMQKSISWPAGLLISSDNFVSKKILRPTRLFCPVLIINAHNRTFLNRKRYVWKRLAGNEWGRIAAGSRLSLSFSALFYRPFFAQIKKGRTIHFKKRIFLIGFIPILETFYFYYHFRAAKSRAKICCLYGSFLIGKILLLYVPFLMFIFWMHKKWTKKRTGEL